MACIYVFTSKSGEVKTYKNKEDLVNDNHNELWNDYVEHSYSNLGLGKSYDWYGKESLKRFKQYVSNVLELTDPIESENITPENVANAYNEDSIENNREVKANLFDKIEAALSNNTIKNKYLHDTLRAHLNRIYDSMGSKDTTTYTQEMLTQLDQLLEIMRNDIQKEIMKYIESNKINEAKELRDAYNEFTNDVEFANSINIVEESEDVADKAEVRARKADAIQGESSLTNTISNKAKTRIVEESHKSGRLDVDNTLTKEEQDQLNAINELREGDTLTAEFENANDVDNPYEANVVLKRNGIKIAVLKPSSKSSKVKDATIAIKDKLKTRKKVNVRVTKLKNTPDNIWATRQLGINNRGANNNILSRIIRKIAGISTEDTIGGYRVARVRKDSNYKNELYNVVTGESVNHRSNDRTDKFYVEVPTVGDKTVWFPVNVSTVSEAVDINKDFGTRLIYETAFRMMEFIEEIRKYNAIKYKIESKPNNPNITETLEELEVQLKSATLEINNKETHLHELIAVGKFERQNGADKSYFNYERNISKVVNSFISSNSMIMSDGTQASLDIRMGKTGDPLIITMAGSVQRIMDLSDPKAMDIFTNIAKSMTRNIQVNENARIDNSSPVELSLRNVKGKAKVFKYKNYGEYLEQTGALLTDMGALTKNGEPISNLNLTSTNLFDMELEDASAGKRTSKSKIDAAKETPISPLDFITTYIYELETIEELKMLLEAFEKTGYTILDTQFTPTDLIELNRARDNRPINKLKRQIEELKKSKGDNSLEIANLESEINKIRETIQNKAERTMLHVNHADKVIMTTSNMASRLEQANKEIENGNVETANALLSNIQSHVTHELLHPVLNASLSSLRESLDNEAFVCKLMEYVSEVTNVIKQIENQMESVLNAPNSKWTTAERDRFRYWFNNILVPLSKMSIQTASRGAIPQGLEELFTYAFTNKTIADVLNQMNYTPNEGEVITGETKTMFQKIIDMLLSLLNITLNKNSILSKVKDIVGTYYNSSKYWEQLDQSNIESPTIEELTIEERTIKEASKKDTSKSTKSTPQGKERNIAIASETLSDIVTAVEQLNINVDTLSIAELQNEHALKLYNSLMKLLDLNAGLRESYLEAFETSLSEYGKRTVVTAMQFMLGSVPISDFKSLISHFASDSTRFKNAVMNPTNNLGALNYINNIKEEIDELEDSDITKLKEFIVKVQESLPGDNLESQDLPASEELGLAYDVTTVATRILEAMDGYVNGKVTSKGEKLIHQFNKELVDTGLPAIFTLDGRTVNIDNNTASIINDIVNNVRYKEVGALVLFRTEGNESGHILNGIFDVTKFDEPDSLLFGSIGVNVRVNTLGYMVENAITQAISDVAFKDNDQIDADAFELSEIQQGIIDYFGGRDNVIKMFYTPVTSLTDIDGKSIALISALPILQSRTTDYVIGEGSSKRVVHIPTAKLNNTGFSEMVLDDIANSLLYFFGKTRRNSVILLEKLFDDKALNSDRVAVRNELVAGVESILSFYKDKLDKGNLIGSDRAQIEAYVNNLTKIVDDLKFQDSEVWNRFISYISKELDIAEETTVAIDKLIDNAVQGKGTLFGKLRVQSKQTISSNVKHLLWGNIIIPDKESNLEHAKTLNSEDGNLQLLHSLINKGNVVVSKHTGLPTTMSAGETKDILVSGARGSVNKSDFVYRLEAIANMYPTLYPIVDQVTKKGNEALLRKLYSAVKLQAPYYVVGNIRRNRRDNLGEIVFNTRNPDINPAMAVASDINNKVTSILRYKNSDELRRLNRLISKHLSYIAIDKNVSDNIVRIILELSTNGYKFAIRKAIDAIVDKDSDFVFDFTTLINKYNKEIAKVSKQKAGVENANKKGAKDKLSISELGYYYEGIKTFKRFNEISYYFPLDSFFTTVDLSTAYSYQLPSQLTEMLDRFNNETELLNLGVEWYSDPSMKYNRLFKHLFKIVKGKVKIRNPKAVGTYTYANLGGIVNEYINSEIEYEQLLGKDWLSAQMLSYLSEFTLMNSSSDASRMYGINIQGNKTVLNNKDLSVLYNLVNKTKDVSMEELNKIKAFNSIRDVLYGELNEMIVARNAFYTFDDVDGTLSERSDINKVKLLNKVHKSNGELLKNGVATGKVFTFDSLKIKTKSGYITFEKYLKDKGVNLIINGVPIFKSELTTGSKAVDLDSVLNLAENFSIKTAIDEFIKDYLVSAISDRLTAIEPIADKLLEIRKAPNTEVNKYTNKGYDKLVNEDQDNINLWAYSFILDEILTNFDWNKIFQGDSIEFGDAVKQSKRLNQIIRPGVAILSDESLRSLTISDASTISNIIDKINERIPEMSKFYTGKDSVKDEASTDGMSFMTKKGFKRFIYEQGLEDKYSGFLNALESKDYDSDAFKYGIQSLKTFYFDRSVKDYGNGYSKMTSEQVKHSIYVILDEFVYSEDQRKLLKFLDDNNIDIVDFASTEKVGTTSVFELMDPKTKRIIDTSTIDVNELESYVHVRPINKYRTQLELPQHGVDYEGKIATQMKRIFENLKLGDEIYDIDGTKYTGKQIFTMYQDLFSLNIEAEAFNLFKEFGVTFINDRPYINPVTGTYEINKNAVYNFMHEFVNKYYNDANLNEGIELDETGESKLPLWFTTIAPQLQQRIVSRIREKVLEQRNVGAHAAIVANAFIGGSFTTLDKVDNGKITFREDYLKDVNENRNGDMGLHIKYKTVTNSDGSTKDILVAEAIISTPTGKFLDKGKHLDINELYELDPKMFQMLAHRIPLEGEQSTIMIDVVGIMNNKASHVILPDDVAVKSGADFDIDTEYMLAYNLERYNGKLRTVPYYTKLTPENEDYLYSKYANEKIADIIKVNLIKLKSDHRAQTNAKIKDSRNLTNEEFDKKIKELFEYERDDTAFYDLPKELRNRFKELEQTFRRRGEEGFSKFKTYAGLVDNLGSIMQILSTEENIKRAEEGNGIATLSKDADVSKFLEDAYTMIKNSSNLKRVRIGNTINALQTEYTEDLKYYQSGLDNIASDRMTAITNVYTENWSNYKSTLSNSINEFIESIVSKEEFRKLPMERMNSKAARQNRLLDIQSSIITSDAHFENVMKVNEFEDSLAVANEVNKLLGNDLSNLDHNNGNDRDTLHSLMLSAKRLKGISIAFDRLLSILRPINGMLANKSIEIPILKADVHADNITIENLEAKYGKGNISTQGDYYIINVTHLGNNYTGDGTTIYNSNIFKFIHQATAHILDSAANPTSKNLNEYTIGVYKLLTVTGITHKVALGDNKQASENAYYYADLYINHPAAIEISDAYLDRSGVLAKQYSSTDTEIITRDLKDSYIRDLYKLILSKDKSNTIGIIEEKIPKNKTLDVFKFSNLSKSVKDELLDTLTEKINKLDNTKDIVLESGIPTIKSIKDAIATERTAPNSARAIANKFAFLDHWVQMRDISNDITQLTNILKTDNINLNDSSILSLDYNIGDASYSYDTLRDLLYKVPNQKIKYPNVVEEVNKFKQLTLQQKRHKVNTEYSKAGLPINKLYKFTVEGENLLESVLPSAFGMNKPGSYASLNSFYRHGVVLSKSISDAMFAYNFPMGKEIIQALTKGTRVTDKNIKTAINWFNGWLATSSSVANMTQGEKYRVLTERASIGTTYSYETFGNKIKVYKKVTPRKGDYNANITPRELNETEIAEMPFAEKFKLVQSLGEFINGYDFIKGSSVVPDRSKVSKEHNYSRDSFMKLIFPPNVTERQAQDEIITMYYDTASPIFKSLVEDLYKYSFLTDGLVYGNKISKFLPFRFLTQPGFMGDSHSFGQLLHIEASKLHNKEEVIVTGIGEIRRMFHQSNWNNSAFVPTFTSKNNDAFKDATMFNNEFADLGVNAIVIAKKEYIDENSKYSGRTYIRDYETNKLYERLDPSATAALQLSDYYIYRNIARLDKFEYKDSYNIDYRIPNEEALEQAVELAYNGNIVVPTEEGVYKTMTKVTGDMLESRQLQPGEQALFKNMKSGLRIAQVSDNPYNIKYALNSVANKKTLEIQAAASADLSIVIDFNTNDIETESLFKTVNSTSTNTTVKLNPSNKNEFKRDLINAIRTVDQSSGMINISLHAVDISKIASDKSQSIIDNLYDISNILEALPIAAISNTSNNLNPKVNILMANNAQFAGSISNYITNTNVNRGENADISNTVDTAILFSKNFLTYRDEFTTEINQLDEYGKVDNLESMDLNDVQVNDKAVELKVNQDIMDSATNGNPGAFVRRAANNAGVGTVKTISDIVGENTNFVDTIQSETNKRHGTELHDMATKLTVHYLNGVKEDKIKELLVPYRERLIANKTIDEIVSVDELFELVKYVGYSILNNRMHDNKEGTNELLDEVTVASLNPDYTDGNKKGLIITGRLDFVDMNNQGGAVYDLKFSSSSTQTPEYYKPYDEQSPSKFWNHTLQVALGMRLLERPAPLRDGSGITIAPRISPKYGYIIPIRFKLSTYEPGVPATVVGFEFEPTIDVARGASFQRAIEYAKKEDIVPMSPHEKVLFNERQKLLELRSTIDGHLEAKSIVKNLASSLISLSKKYSNSGNDELIEATNIAIAQMAGKFESNAIDVNLLTVAERLRAFTSFATVALEQISNKLNRYDSPMLNMKQIVTTEGNNIEFQRTMNLANWIIKMVEEARKFSTFEVESIEDNTVKEIITDYNNVVNTYNSLTDGSNQLKNIYIGLIKEYMAEKIANFSTNPNVKPFVVRNEHGKLNMDKAEKLFTFEDISVFQLYLDSRFDHGIPFDDAIGMVDRKETNRIDRQKRTESIKFERLLAKALKKDPKWRYRDNININKEITKWFKDTFIAKDVHGNDSMHLVTAHNEHMFYATFLEMRDKMLIKMKDWNENEAKDIEEQVRKDYKEGRTIFNRANASIDNVEDGVNYALKHARSKVSLEHAKELHEFYQENGDYDNRNKIAVGEGAARQIMSVDEFITKYTEGMSTEQKRVFLTYNNILRDENHRYIAIRPISQSLSNTKEVAPNEQFQRIMEDPDLKNLYEYLIGVTGKLLDFNRGIIVDPSRVPLMYGKRRTAGQSLKRFIGISAMEQSDSMPFKSSSGHVTYSISPPMLGLLFGGTRYIFRNKSVDETKEEYETSVIEDVNEEYGTDFTKFQDIILHNKEVTMNRKQETLDIMEYNPYKIYSRFIEESHNYKKRIALDEEYSLYRSFFSEVSRVYVTQGGKPKKDTSYQKANNVSEFMTEQGDISKLYKNIELYMKTQIYHSNEFKMSKRSENIIKSLQQVTSLRVMAFNVRAGVKNVSKGLVDIFSEGYAGRYVDSKSLREGFAAYRGAIVDLLANIHSYESGNLAAAFIRDHSSLLEKQTEKGAEIKRDIQNVMDKLLVASDAAYIFNNVGEHVMQYGMYLSMLKAHRIIDGKIQNKSDFMGNVAMELLESKLPAETVNDFKDFVKEQIEKNTFRPFDFRDYLSQWMVRSTILQRDKALLKQIKDIYKGDYKKLLKSKTEEFSTYVSVYDAHELKDGMLSLKEEHSYNDNEFLRLKERVRAVNHSLHGIYNVKDSSGIMAYAFGKAASQFRKWMRPNWNRWYGKRFNRVLYHEGMRSFDANAAMSTFNFAFAPIIEARKLSKDERASVNLFKSMLNYAGNLKTMYRTLDPMERQAIRRFTFNIMALMTTIAGAALLAGSADLDKWKKESKGNDIIYAFLMYQMSALGMELGEFTPIVGWKSILDRFVDSPMPLTRTLTDGLELLNYASGELGSLMGIPYESDYQSGPKKGWNKLQLQAMSMIPGVREVYSMLTLSSIVDFYKMYDTTGLLRFYETLRSASRESDKVKKVPINP